MPGLRARQETPVQLKFRADDGARAIDLDDTVRRYSRGSMPAASRFTTQGPRVQPKPEQPKPPSFVSRIAHSVKGFLGRRYK
jgi:hypothetical protein